MNEFFITSDIFDPHLIKIIFEYTSNETCDLISLFDSLEFNSVINKDFCFPLGITSDYSLIEHASEFKVRKLFDFIESYKFLHLKSLNIGFIDNADNESSLLSMIVSSENEIENIELKNLEFLSVIYCSYFTGISLKNCKSIKSLVLDANQRFDSKYLSFVKDLQCLKISCCKRFDSKHLQLCSNLTELNIEFQWNSFESIYCCSNLKSLCLNKCKNLSEINLTKLQHLTKLTIKFSNISDIINIKNLETLCVECCRYFSGKSLLTENKLENLSIETCQIFNEDNMINLNNLSLLKLINVKKFTGKYLMNHKCLKTLYISNCQNLKLRCLNECVSLINLIFGCVYLFKMNKLEFCLNNVTSLTLYYCNFDLSFIQCFPNLKQINIKSF